MNHSQTCINQCSLFDVFIILHIIYVYRCDLIYKHKLLLAIIEPNFNQIVCYSMNKYAATGR